MLRRLPRTLTRWVGESARLPARRSITRRITGSVTSIVTHVSSKVANLFRTGSVRWGLGLPHVVRWRGATGAVPRLLVPVLAGFLFVWLVHAGGGDDEALPLVPADWQSYDVGAAQLRDSGFWLDVERADREVRKLRYNETRASFVRESFRFYQDAKLAKWENDARLALAELIAWRSATSGFTRPGFSGPTGNYCTAEFLRPWWGGLAQAAAQVCFCESGGRAGADAGAYHGLFQFDAATWGEGHETAAFDPAENARRAKLLYDARGAQPWPSCGRFFP